LGAQPLLLVPVVVVVLVLPTSVVLQSTLVVVVLVLSSSRLVSDIDRLGHWLSYSLIQLVGTLNSDSHSLTDSRVTPQNFLLYFDFKLNTPYTWHVSVSCLFITIRLTWNWFRCHANASQSSTEHLDRPFMIQPPCIPNASATGIGSLRTRTRIYSYRGCDWSRRSVGHPLYPAVP